MTTPRSSRPTAAEHVAPAHVWLIFELILLLTTVLVIYLVPPSSPFALLRVLLGAVLIFLLPGYHLTALLFEPNLSILRRSVLGVGLSIALTTFFGLFLNYTPIGITLDSVLLSLTAATLLFLALEYRARPET